MENILDKINIVTHCDMDNLVWVGQSVDHVWKQSVFNAFLNSNNARALLPYIIVLAECVSVLVLANQGFFFFGSQVHDHLLWFAYYTPLSWLEISLDKVIRKLENFLIVLFSTVAEVLAEFFDPVSDIT